MGKLSILVASILLAAVLISSAPSKIYGDQDSGIGDFVNVAPLKHGDWKTPPGHYGLLALYADSFLSASPLNGSYQVTWSFVEPDLSDYFIVDVRPNTAYCTNHIIGAVNIPYATVAKPYNLDKLPTDQPTGLLRNRTYIQPSRTSSRHDGIPNSDPHDAIWVGARRIQGTLSVKCKHLRALQRLDHKG
jgi:hypothetical protein